MNLKFRASLQRRFIGGSLSWIQQKHLLIVSRDEGSVRMKVVVDCYAPERRGAFIRGEDVTCGTKTT